MPKAPTVNVGNSKKAVHPNSRKASQLSRKRNHDQKIDRISSVKQLKLDSLGEKLLWFQSNINSEQEAFTKRDLADLVESYLHRFDDELEQISIVNEVGGRRGQRHAAREDAIRITLQQEQEEWMTHGMEVPDLINGKSLKIFRAWQGEMRYIQNLKFRRISSREAAVVDSGGHGDAKNSPVLDNMKVNSAEIESIVTMSGAVTDLVSAVHEEQVDKDIGGVTDEVNAGDNDNDNDVDDNYADDNDNDWEDVEMQDEDATRMKVRRKGKQRRRLLAKGAAMKRC